jgi:NAD(P)-dependent dehydrogenase (short-subunit alcohol dehydrogenase family)
MSCAAGQLYGRVAVVTGAAGQVGSAIVSTLLQAGASVVGVVRRQPARQSEKSGDGDGRGVLLVRADVRNQQDVKRAVTQAIRQFGKIDILVNNAAARGPTAPVTKLTLKAWQEVIDTNLTGPFLFSRECLRHMVKQNEGQVINISSVVARWAYPLRAPYAASKAALISLTLTLAQEAGRANVRVNAVCPGPVEGEALQGVLNERAQALEISPDEMERRFMRPAALGRKVTADDISRLVLFLCSDAARNVTGQVIDVSAGYGLYPGI